MTSLRTCRVRVSSSGLPLRMKMRGALWSAVACYRFTPGQLAGRAGYTVPRLDEAASKFGIKAAAAAAGRTLDPTGA